MEIARAEEIMRLLERIVDHGLGRYSEMETKAICWLGTQGYAGNVGVSPAELAEMARSLGIQRASLRRILSRLADDSVLLRLRIGRESHYALNPGWSP